MEDPQAEAGGAMLAADQQSTGGPPPPPSPLSGCYLLIVIGEPHSPEHKEIILQKIAKGFLSWDVESSHVDLEKELQALTSQAPEGEEARNGERLIQYATENLVTEVLIHPQVNTLLQCIRNLLSSFTRHRHLIHAGYTFAGNGSWILQDGTFSLADFIDAFQETDVQRVLRAYENCITVDVHCSPEGDWSTERLSKESFSRSCKVKLNPDDRLTAGGTPIGNFINYISPFLRPASIEQLLEPSDVVGNIRFSHPTLYVFPGGQGDAALFGINGFNMLVDGGFARKACFWDFARHLDRLDAVLITRLNNGNVNGIAAVLRRKKQSHVYPQIGHFFSNLQERRHCTSPDGDKDRDPLLVNLADEGHEMVLNLRHLQLRPHPCYRDGNHVDPVNLYHKVGHGKLDMYIISPARDSREVKEFLAKWNSNDPHLFSSLGKKDNSKEFHFPLQNLISICALLVWQPANPSDTITRILFPGSTPQQKIFEGLDKLRNLEFLKYPVCSARSLSPSASTVGLSTRASSKQRSAPAVIDKLLPGEGVKAPSRTVTTETNKQAHTPKAATIPVASMTEIKQTKPATPISSTPAAVPKAPQPQMKPKAEKIASRSEPAKPKTEIIKPIDGEKSVTKTERVAKVSGEVTKAKVEHKSKVETKTSISKTKIDTKPPRSVERKTQKATASTIEKKSDAKSSPTTPKKIIESKVNGVVSKTESVKATRTSSRSRPSPTATPAKSTKEANNRKVVESKYHVSRVSTSRTSVSRATKREISETTTKIDRKPISRRPKTGSPSKPPASRPPGSPAKSSSAKSTPTPSVKSDKDGVIRKTKGEAEKITTDSSAVSTPSTVDPETAALRAKGAEVEDKVSPLVNGDLTVEEKTVVQEIEDAIVAEEIPTTLEEKAEETDITEIVSEAVESAVKEIAEITDEKEVISEKVEVEEEKEITKIELQDTKVPTEKQEEEEEEEEEVEKESEIIEEEEIHLEKHLLHEKEELEGTEEEQTEDIEDVEGPIDVKESLQAELELEAKQKDKGVTEGKEKDEDEEEEEYLVIEKEEQYPEESIQEQESLESHIPDEVDLQEIETEEEEGELQKHLRDEVESEKQKKERISEKKEIKVNGIETEEEEVEEEVKDTAKKISDKEEVLEVKKQEIIKEPDTVTETELKEDVPIKGYPEEYKPDLKEVSIKDEITTSAVEHELLRKETIPIETKEQIEEEVQDIITSAKEIVTKTKLEAEGKAEGIETELDLIKTDKLKEKQTEDKKEVEEVEELKEISSTSPEEKLDISSEKNREVTDDTRDTDQKLEEEQDEGIEVKETGSKDVADQRYPAEESQPDEKFSTTIESAATTAPTLPEDERIPLDEIKEIVEEKYVKEETKEKEKPVVETPRLEQPTTLPQVVIPAGIALYDPHLPHVIMHQRDIVKTPDEVADLPVHEEVDPGMYESDDFSREFQKAKEDIVPFKKQDLEDSRQQSPELDIKGELHLKYEDTFKLHEKKDDETKEQVTEEYVKASEEIISDLKKTIDYPEVVATQPSAEKMTEKEEFEKVSDTEKQKVTDEFPTEVTAGEQVSDTDKIDQMKEIPEQKEKIETKIEEKVEDSTALYPKEMDEAKIQEDAISDQDKKPENEDFTKSEVTDIETKDRDTEKQMFKLDTTIDQKEKVKDITAHFLEAEIEFVESEIEAKEIQPTDLVETKGGTVDEKVIPIQEKEKISLEDKKEHKQPEIQKEEKEIKVSKFDEKLLPTLFSGFVEVMTETVLDHKVDIAKAGDKKEEIIGKPEEEVTSETDTMKPLSPSSKIQETSEPEILEAPSALSATYLEIIEKLQQETQPETKQEDVSKEKVKLEAETKEPSCKDILIEEEERLKEPTAFGIKPDDTELKTDPISETKPTEEVVGTESKTDERSTDELPLSKEIKDTESEPEEMELEKETETLVEAKKIEDLMKIKEKELIKTEVVLDETIKGEKLEHEEDTKAETQKEEPMKEDQEPTKDAKQEIILTDKTDLTTVVEPTIEKKVITEVESTQQAQEKSPEFEEEFEYAKEKEPSKDEEQPIFDKKDADIQAEKKEPSKTGDKEPAKEDQVESIVTKEKETFKKEDHLRAEEKEFVVEEESLCSADKGLTMTVEKETMKIEEKIPTKKEDKEITKEETELLEAEGIPTTGEEEETKTVSPIEPTKTVEHLKIDKEEGKEELSETEQLVKMKEKEEIPADIAAEETEKFIKEDTKERMEIEGLVESKYITKTEEPVMIKTGDEREIEETIKPTKDEPMEEKVQVTKIEEVIKTEKEHKETEESIKAEKVEPTKIEEEDQIKAEEKIFSELDKAGKEEEEIIKAKEEELPKAEKMQTEQEEELTKFEKEEPSKVETTEKEVQEEPIKMGKVEPSKAEITEKGEKEEPTVEKEEPSKVEITEMQEKEEPVKEEEIEPRKVEITEKEEKKEPEIEKEEPSKVDIAEKEKKEESTKIEKEEPSKEEMQEKEEPVKEEEVEPSKVEITEKEEKKEPEIEKEEPSKVDIAEKEKKEESTKIEKEEPSKEEMQEKEEPVKEEEVEPSKVEITEKGEKKEPEIEKEEPSKVDKAEKEKKEESTKIEKEEPRKEEMQEKEEPIKEEKVEPSKVETTGQGEKEEPKIEKEEPSKVEIAGKEKKEELVKEKVEPSAEEIAEKEGPKKEKEEPSKVEIQEREEKEQSKVEKEEASKAETAERKEVIIETEQEEPVTTEKVEKEETEKSINIKVKKEQLKEEHKDMIKLEKTEEETTTVTEGKEPSTPLEKQDLKIEKMEVATFDEICEVTHLEKVEKKEDIKVVTKETTEEVEKMEKAKPIEATDEKLKQDDITKEEKEVDEEKYVELTDEEEKELAKDQVDEIEKVEIQKEQKEYTSEGKEELIKAEDGRESETKEEKYITEEPEKDKEPKEVKKIESDVFKSKEISQEKEVGEMHDQKEEKTEPVTTDIKDAIKMNEKEPSAEEDKASAKLTEETSPLEIQSKPQSPADETKSVIEEVPHKAGVYKTTERGPEIKEREEKFITETKEKEGTHRTEPVSLDDESLIILEKTKVEVGYPAGHPEVEKEDEQKSDDDHLEDVGDGEPPPSPGDEYIDSGLEEEPVYAKLEAPEHPEYVTVTPDSTPASPKALPDFKISTKAQEEESIIKVSLTETLQKDSIRTTTGVQEEIVTTTTKVLEEMPLKTKKDEHEIAKDEIPLMTTEDKETKDAMHPKLPVDSKDFHEIAEEPPEEKQTEIDKISKLVDKSVVDEANALEDKVISIKKDIYSDKRDSESFLFMEKQTEEVQDESQFVCDRKLSTEKLTAEQEKEEKEIAETGSQLSTADIQDEKSLSPFSTRGSSPIDAPSETKEISTSIESKERDTFITTTKETVSEKLVSDVVSTSTITSSILSTVSSTMSSVTSTMKDITSSICDVTTEEKAEVESSEKEILSTATAQATDVSHITSVTPMQSDYITEKEDGITSLDKISLIASTSADSTISSSVVSSTVSTMVTSKKEEKSSSVVTTEELSEKEIKKEIDEKETCEGDTLVSTTVRRMVVTASSEDGGAEIELCPTGSITFSSTQLTSEDGKFIDSEMTAQISETQESTSAVQTSEIKSETAETEKIVGMVTTQSTQDISLTESEPITEAVTVRSITPVKKADDTNGELHSSDQEVHTSGDEEIDADGKVVTKRTTKTTTTTTTRIIRRVRDTPEGSESEDDHKDSVTEETITGEDGKTITRRITRKYVTVIRKDGESDEEEKSPSVSFTEDHVPGSPKTITTTTYRTISRKGGDDVEEYSSDSDGGIVTRKTTTTTTVTKTLSGDGGEGTATATTKEVVTDDGTSKSTTITTKDIHGDISVQTVTEPTAVKTDEKAEEDAKKDTLCGVISSAEKISKEIMEETTAKQLSEKDTKIHTSVIAKEITNGDIVEHTSGTDKSKDTTVYTTITTSITAKDTSDLASSSSVPVGSAISLKKEGSEIIRSTTPGSDVMSERDLDLGGPSTPHSDISSGQVSQAATNIWGGSEGRRDSHHCDSDEDDGPVSPMSVTSQVAHSPPTSHFEFDVGDPQRTMSEVTKHSKTEVAGDVYTKQISEETHTETQQIVSSSMTSSFYGSLPPDPKEQEHENGSLEKLVETLMSSSYTSHAADKNGSDQEHSALTSSQYTHRESKSSSAIETSCYESFPSGKQTERDDALDFERALYEHRAVRGEDLTRDSTTRGPTTTYHYETKLVESKGSPSHIVTYEHHKTGVNGQRLSEEHSLREFTEDYGNGNVAGGKQYEDLMNRNRDVQHMLEEKYNGKTIEDFPEKSYKHEVFTSSKISSVEALSNGSDERKKTVTTTVTTLSGTEHDPMFHHQFPAPSLPGQAFPEPPQGFGQPPTTKTEVKKDPIEGWGKPLGLPAPAPPPANNTQSDVVTVTNTNKTTPKKEKKVMQMKKSMIINENNKTSGQAKDTKTKSPESPVKQKGGSNKDSGRNAKSSGNPIYVDLTYVPHHGNSYYTSLEFFKKVRARYYVFSGTEPSREVYNALLEAKQTWEDKELEVTIIPTYDTDTLGYWVAENEDILAKYKIDLSPSASRCTINLQDHETSCSAYRLEF